MEALGVDARIKTGRSDIATVDWAIGHLKEIIQRYRVSSGEADWGSFLQKAVKAFNHTRLDYMMDQRPKNVQAGSDLEFMLQRKISSSRSTTSSCLRAAPTV